MSNLRKKLAKLNKKASVDNLERIDDYELGEYMVRVIMDTENSPITEYVGQIPASEIQNLISDHHSMADRVIDVFLKYNYAKKVIDFLNEVVLSPDKQIEIDSETIDYIEERTDLIDHMVDTDEDFQKYLEDTFKFVLYGDTGALVQDVINEVGTNYENRQKRIEELKLSIDEAIDSGDYQKFQELSTEYNKLLNLEAKMYMKMKKIATSKQFVKSLKENIMKHFK